MVVGLKRKHPFETEEVEEPSAAIVRESVPGTINRLVRLAHANSRVCCK